MANLPSNMTDSEYFFSSLNFHLKDGKTPEEALVATAGDYATFHLGLSGGDIPPQEGSDPMSIKGVHLRNDKFMPTADWEALWTMKPAWMKAMSVMDPLVFRDLKKNYPKSVIVNRLYGHGFGPGGQRPTPKQFFDQVAHHIQETNAYCDFYQIHNEPNHTHQIEGWDDSIESAKSFNEWYLKVRTLMARHWPAIRYVFPGLAVPHNDLGWLPYLEDSIEVSDVLGVHCYWQNPGPNDKNHLDGFWGLRFKHYHEAFPMKTIAILEAGNSNHQTPGLPHDENKISQELAEWFNELARYPYVVGAMPYMMSSPDPTWEPFAWVKSDGRRMPIVSMFPDLLKGG